MGKHGYTSSGSTQLSAKIGEDLKEDFRDTCKENGETMTDVVESLLAGYVADHGNAPVSDENLPEDGRLRDGYQRLREVSDPDTGRIDTDEALSTVAEAVGIKKGAVRRTVIKPLDRRGLLQPKWGTIVVKDPGEISEEPADRDITSKLLKHNSQDDGQCIGHHPNQAGTTCLKCGVSLGDGYQTVRCDCGTVLNSESETCPNCRIVTEEIVADD